MKHIQDLLNYLNVERTRLYHLEVRDHDSGIWTAAIKDWDGFLAEDPDTEEFVYQQGETMIHAIYALDAQCAAIMGRYPDRLTSFPFNSISDHEEGDA